MIKATHENTIIGNFLADDQSNSSNKYRKVWEPEDFILTVGEARNEN